MSTSRESLPRVSLPRVSLPRLLVGIVLACGAVLFFLAFERVEETEVRTVRGEAAVNPYYALQAMLEELGVPTRAMAHLRALPPLDHTLLLGAPSRGAGTHATERLLGWARQGGHLVVVPVAEDPLLAALGVERFDESAADDDDAQSVSRFASSRPTWPKLWWSEAGPEDTVLRADGADDAAWLLTVPVGAGAVTVVSDGGFLHNGALGTEDHALIAWHTVAFRDVPGGVWIVYRDLPPSLAALLGARFEILAWSLAALVVTGLLFLARRVGPVEAVTARDRRHLEEHVRAVGSYLWRIGAADALVEPVRDAVRRTRLRVETVASADDRGSDHTLVQRLEEELRDGGPLAATRLSPRAVREAFAARGEMTAQKLLRVLRTLETLRRSS